MAKYGWVPDPDAVAEFVSTLPHASFGAALEGGIVADDGDALCYKAMASLSPDLLRDGRLTSRDQKQTNSCVGNGTASGGDITTACEIVLKKERERWPGRQAADAMYAIGLMAVNRLWGDQGSNGSWAARGVMELGTVHMLDYGDGLDLSEWSQERTKKWSKAGLPAVLKQKAGEHKMGTAAQIKSVDEARQALQNGYGINVCSTQGFTSKRDAAGFCKPSGSWAHSMTWIAYRGGRRPGLLTWNSWGDNAQSGPIWPDDQPWGSFWIDLNVAEKMIRAGDTFAYSNYAGFPRQTPYDWMRDPQATSYSWMRGI